MSIHICSPNAIAVRRKIMRCPVCKVRRRFTSVLYGWYGWDVTCHTCGVCIRDGEYRKPGKAEAQRNREQARVAWAKPYDRSAEYYAEYHQETAQ